MRLDLTSLRKALTSLDRGLERALAAPADEELRDACIQRFEYSYELAFKMLRRQLEAESENPGEIDTLSFKQILRKGGERGLIASVEAWFGYRAKRNLTAHIYDQAKAAEVFAVLPAFAADAADLLRRLQGRDA